MARETVGWGPGSQVTKVLEEDRAIGCDRGGYQAKEEERTEVTSRFSNLEWS